MTDRPATESPGQDPAAESVDLRNECERLRRDLAASREREATALESTIYWRAQAVRTWTQAGAGSVDRREVVALRERADHLLEELERTRKTVSWRVTAPLRRIRRLRPPRAAR